ncbi:MAG: response regulator, partial [Acetobacteraceae bacterium]|nr:response regulator [Acetobacteraceae bacterium]
FEAAAEGYALLDADGRLLRANAALARMAGAAVPLTPGLAVEHLVAAAARPALRALLAAAGQGDAPPILATPADPAAPTDAEWQVRARVLPRTSDQPVSPLLLLTVTDHSEQRRAALRLAAAARLETVGRLAGGIAHDFNNLLGAILGAAAAAREAGTTPDASTELEQVEGAARRGAALVRQLLAFARQQPMQPRVIDLRRALEEAGPLLRRLLGRDIAVELTLEAEVAPVRVDPAQLDQVLLNLAANAKEAMPEGGRLRIGLGRAVVLRREGEGADAVPPGRYVVLEVSDTGRGIPPEVVPRLFEPFFTTRPERGGTGLGLATVQGIVAQSGGHIAVHSVVGEGTRFRIHFPRAEAAPELVPPSPVAPAEGARSAADSSTRPAPSAGALLLVDDEAPLRRLSARILERAGYAVRVADSAESALELLEGEAEPPLALVSDVAMPGMDGLTLARRLRARWPGLPVWCWARTWRARAWASSPSPSPRPSSWRSWRRCWMAAPGKARSRTRRPVFAKCSCLPEVAAP